MPELTVAWMQRTAGLAGFPWTQEELERIRPVVERVLAMIEELETIPLGEVEPSTQFRMM